MPAKIKNTMERYELLQLGAIVFAYCDTELSVGLLELDPRKELAKHNRPVAAELLQISGTCVMKLFNGDKLVNEVTLEKGESVTIPANQYHIHANPTDETSITLWKFAGDIMEVIDAIRNR